MRVSIQKPRFQSYSNLIKDKTQLKFHSQTPKLSNSLTINSTPL
jgi:hypothetical protein